VRPRPARSEASPAIEVRGLTKRYGPTTAVAGLDLDVAAGETLALLGPNGAGKTTTVECCMGYRVPDEGTVRVLGLDPRRDRARLTPRVGLMLQEGGVYPHAYPDEVLRLFAAFHRAPRSPEELLERVGLQEARRTRFRDLSGGQKQRLSLALALVGRPEIVYLDEPTTGLDVAARHRTWELIAELQADGVTVVLTTHLLDEAEQLADRLAIVDRGRLVAVGTPTELTRGDQAAVTLRSRPGLETGRLASAVAAPVRETLPGTYVVEAGNDPALVTAVAAWLADQDATLSSFDAGRSSLEDVFLRLTSTTSGRGGAQTDADTAGSSAEVVR
jgi:ABC-2 type transport system ATP-binding protein